MRLYPPPLHPPPSSSPLTSALGLPPSFGLIHTGSPFTFHLSLLPHPETPPGTSQLTIKLQTPQARIPLLSVSHDSREQKTIIHSVPLTSEGPHTLRVLSTSDNGATLRKFYKFDVTGPFLITTSSFSLPTKVLTTLKIKSNLSTLTLVTVTFTSVSGSQKPVPPFKLKSGGTHSLVLELPTPAAGDETLGSYRIGYGNSQEITTSPVPRPAPGRRERAEMKLQSSFVSGREEGDVFVDAGRGERKVGDVWTEQFTIVNASPGKVDVRASQEYGCVRMLESDIIAGGVGRGERRRVERRVVAVVGGRGGVRMEGGGEAGDWIITG